MDRSERISGLKFRAGTRFIKLVVCACLVYKGGGWQCHRMVEATFLETGFFLFEQNGNAVPESLHQIMRLYGWPGFLKSTSTIRNLIAHRRNVQVEGILNFPPIA